MQKIKQLPVHEAQKIAAGEVVERPSNVVKELIENSLDAGATSISIYIEQAGKKLIRIVDNGCGMSDADARLCFAQHATSKITSVDDLATIATFGFRGEALASIASVSNITLITKDDTADHGIKLTLHQGSITSEESIGCTTGVDISIADLFFNLPARKKFLKTDETEWRSILNLIQALCLDYINIHIKLLHDGKQVLNCPPTDSITKRCAQLWDHNFASNMIAIEAHNAKDNITIHGAISNHQYARYDRNQIYLFVNLRWIKNQQLSSALLKGYLNVLPAARYPAAAIFITVDAAAVDINIHPRKEEVQFLHPNKVATLLSATVKQTLEQHLSNQLRKPVTFAQPIMQEPFGKLFSQPFIREEFKPQASFTPFDFDAFEMPKNEPFMPLHMASFGQPSTPKAFEQPQVPVYQEPVFEEENLSLVHNSAAQAQEQYTIIGQYHKTYILLEQVDGLFLIDQHAAHERVLYELFAKRFHDVATIQLLFPPIVNLSSQDADLIEHHRELFKSHGIELERFGNQQIIIQSTPAHIKDVALDEFLRQTVQLIQESQTVDKELFTKTLNEKLQAQMACKAAVKAGDILSRITMEQLLNDLYKTSNRFSCPHGRPTGWLLSLHEIEKKFKRKL